MPKLVLKSIAFNVTKFHEIPHSSKDRQTHDFSDMLLPDQTINVEIMFPRPCGNISRRLDFDSAPRLPYTAENHIVFEMFVIFRCFMYIFPNHPFKRPYRPAEHRS